MGAPKVLRSLCAQIDWLASRPSYLDLIDVAIAANRLGWPEIAEAILDEVRPIKQNNTYRIFNNLIEEMSDPERIIRQYLKALPTQWDMERDPYCVSTMARSLARSGLGSRLREVVDPLIARIEKGSRSLKDPLLRFHLMRNLAEGLRTRSRAWPLPWPIWAI